ncbi:MAG: galactitol-1-phosphate 5-dehydrogenase [Candidatus Hydrogenedens sp.]
MKALRLYAPGDLRLEEIPIPLPSPDEVLVRILACGICGSDIPRVFEHGTYKYPLIPGHEFSGIVEKVGSETGKDWIGRHVVVYPLIPCRQCSSCYSGLYTQCLNYDYLGSRRDGGFAEYVTVPRDNIIPVPDGVPGEVSAITEPCAVALHAVRKAQVCAGDTVLITGAGTIGILIALWARASGAEVLMTDLIIKKLKFARSLGFQHLLDAGQANVSEWVKQRYKNGVNLVFETTGHPGGLETAIESCCISGRIILVGNPSFEEMKLPAKQYGTILRKEIQITGVWNSWINEYPKNEWQVVLQEFKKDSSLYSKVITHKVPIEGLKELFMEIYNKKVFPIKAIYCNKEINSC